MYIYSIRIISVCNPVALHSIANFDIQWNLSITDTLGTEKQFVIQRFPLFRGCFVYMVVHSDPQVLEYSLL